jgi:DNA-binding protein HU-beta
MKPAQKTLNKTDLAKYIEQEMKCSRRMALRLVNGILKVIKENLEKGGRVQLTPFGVFETRYRAAHKKKNPKTGEALLVKARRIVCFKPGKALRNLRSRE